MSARILVVDDQELNRRLLHSKLASEYYSVQVARDGKEALERAEENPPDIILLDVMMPEIDGYEVCKRLKASDRTRHVPVLMVTGLDDRDARVRALDCGADDYLTKPIDDAQLLARLRNLLKLKPMMDELRAREASGKRVGAIGGNRREEDRGEGARILIVDEEPKRIAEVETALGGAHDVARFGAPDEANQPRPDLMIVSLEGPMIDGLRVIANIRSEEATRRLALLAIANESEKGAALRALDLGADDVVFRPLDHAELAARVRTLIRRKRYLEQMSASVDEGLEAAMIDPLTGLNNRRALEGKLTALLRRSNSGYGGALSVMVVDLDRFKLVNDEYGHGVGDTLLKEFSARLSSVVRPMDMVCRLGGEEFVILMPGTAGDLAALAAERIRRKIAIAPFPVAPRQALSITVSIGVAAARQGDDVAGLLKRADAALYRAKEQGRNRVLSETAA